MEWISGMNAAVNYMEEHILEEPNMDMIHRRPLTELFRLCMGYRPHRPEKAAFLSRRFHRLCFG